MKPAPGMSFLVLPANPNPDAYGSALEVAAELNREGWVHVIHPDPSLSYNINGDAVSLPAAATALNVDAVVIVNTVRGADPDTLHDVPIDWAPCMIAASCRQPGDVLPLVAVTGNLPAVPEPEEADAVDPDDPESSPGYPARTLAELGAVALAGKSVRTVPELTRAKYEASLRDES